MVAKASAKNRKDHFASHVLFRFGNQEQGFSCTIEAAKNLKTLVVSRYYHTSKHSPLHKYDKILFTEHMSCALYLVSEI